MNRTNPLHFLPAVFAMAVFLTVIQPLPAQNSSEKSSETKEETSETDQSDQNREQEKEEKDRFTSFQDAEEGDRVKLLLKNDTVFKGILTEIRKKNLDLDVTYEYMTMSGQITFEKNRVKNVITLPARSEKERKRIKETKKQYRKELQENDEEEEEEKETEKKEEEKNEDESLTKEERQKLLDRFPRSDWPKDRYDRLSEQFRYQRSRKEQEFVEKWEDIKKARNQVEKNARMKLLEEFPPDEGWGEEKYKELQTQRSPHPGRSRPMMTSRERRFYENYDEWKKAYTQRQEEKKEEEEKKEDEKKKTESGEEQETTSSDNTEEGSTEENTENQNTE